MGFSILEIILCIFFSSLVVTVVFRKLRLPVILGYLLVGALVGPNGLELIPQSEGINKLAEFGIVFLMFTIGLEFSLPRLLTLKYPVFVIGGLQVLCSIVFTILVGMLFGINTLSALIVGGVVAMSSTALVIKQLNDQLELHSPHGLNAVGILLFQDLAVIPLIILIASLTHNDGQNLAVMLLLALLKGTFAILIIFLGGRWLLKPVFRLISQTRMSELFTLAVLLVTLTGAWLTHKLGLSFALGAFLAGLMLAETEFRHQIAVEIRPFRDILLGLFFITIGMLTDLSHWYSTAFWIILLLMALIPGKMLLTILITYLSGNSLPTAARTGLVIAQGGEFGFAILTLALKEKIFPTDYGQVVLAALLMSIVFAPLLIRFNKSIATFFLSKIIKIDEDETKAKIAKVAKKLSGHVIICGYGRVGQHIARLLDKVHFPYIGLDLDVELVQRASMGGERVIYGDPTYPDILKAAGIEHAKVLMISFNDLRSTMKILSMVKQTHPHLPILVRCRDEYELKQLKEYGATHVIAELFEESLTLSYHLLKIIDIPLNKISALIQEVRHKDYDLLQKVFTGSYAEHEPDHPELIGELRPILMNEGAYAVNKKLNELQLQEIGVELIAIRRGETKQLKPHGNIKLNPHDIIILYGTPAKLEEAEERLLSGS